MVGSVFFVPAAQNACRKAAAYMLVPTIPYFPFERVPPGRGEISLATKRIYNCLKGDFSSARYSGLCRNKEEDLVAARMYAAAEG